MTEGKEVSTGYSIERESWLLLLHEIVLITKTWSYIFALASQLSYKK